MIQFLLDILSKIPHLNFKFKWINATFDVDFRSEYAQSLAVIAGFCAVILILLLLTIIITWIFQCCSRQDASVKSRRKVKRLSTILFVISVLCFFFLGFSLFGNDFINRGMSESLNGLGDVNRGMKLGQVQNSNLNATCFNATQHIKQLEDVVHEKSKSMGINQTLVSQIDATLTSLSNGMDEVSEKLLRLKGILGEVSYLEKAKMIGERVEIERWMILVTLPSIMLCVLFAGVIAFCRQSKKGAVVFSALGIVIFLVVWTLLCFVLPATVALADFCNNGGAYIRANLNKLMIETLEFYKTCDAKPSHDNVPPVLGVNNVSDTLTNLQTTKTKLDSLLDVTFNRSVEISNASALISIDSAQSLKTVGALASTLACYAYKDDVTMLHYGVCEKAVIGASVLTLCLFLLGAILFALLIIVSRSWHLFTRLPSDYVEVDEDDPFFPRTNDSTIPVDIYGTHVFNPRTRERTDPSTGTTSANTGVGSSDEAVQPLWNRNATAPPATNSLARSPYTENNYGNFNDRYDV